jgi:transcriptional regulator with XRE-family HTH domain
MVSIFRQRLKTALLERGMTQKELAEKSGLSRAGISQYLSGTYTPTRAAMERLAEALDMSATYLAGEMPPMEQEDEALPPLADFGMRNMSIAEAAKILGKPQQFVRIALQQGRAHFGIAVRMPGGTYAYHVSPKRLLEYAGAAGQHAEGN